MSTLALEQFTVNPSADFDLQNPIIGRDFIVGDDNHKNHFVVYGEPESAENGIIHSEHAFSVSETWPVQRWRNGLLARETGMLVIGGSIPGFDKNLTRLGVDFTPEQRKALRNGSWAPYMNQTWEALVPLIQDYTGDPNIIGRTLHHYRGQSMGASTAVAKLSARPEEATTGNVLLWEDVNLVQRRIAGAARVAGRFGLAGIQTVLIEGRKYKEEWQQRPRPLEGANEDFAGNIFHLPAVQALGRNYDSPLLVEAMKGSFYNTDVMLALGQMENQLTLAHSLRQTPDAVAHLWYERLSPMGTRRSTIATAVMLHEAGIAVHLVQGGRAHDAENHIAEAITRQSLALRGETYSEPTGVTV